VIVSVDCGAQAHAYVNEIKKKAVSRSQWPRGPRRRSAVTPFAGIAGSNTAGDMDVGLL
jgi:hypothetical protein